MKQSTRDNIIYLTVGLAVAGLVVFDFFHADSHGLKMWLPSWFAARAVATTGLVIYFAARETRRVGATVFQMLVCTVLVAIVHVGVAFTFRQAFDHLPTISFAPLVIVEMFVLVELAVQFARWLKSRGKRALTHHQSG